MSREIDARVAREVMGLTVNPDGMSLPCDDGYRKLPYYSTSMDAAMEMVKELRGKGITVSILGLDDETKWRVSLSSRNTFTRMIYKEDDSPTMSICLAALEAVKYDR